MLVGAGLGLALTAKAGVELALGATSAIADLNGELCAAPRFFVGTGQVQRRIISWELARGVRGNLTREEL